MGIEAIIKNMDPKLKNLFGNIMSVIMVLMMAYGAITFILVYTQTKSFMTWFNTPHFVTTIIVLVFIGMGYKILKGGKLTFQEQQKGKKMEFNIPDVYGVKKTKQGQQTTRLNIPNPFGAKNQQRINIPNSMEQRPTRTPLRGSWTCPNCGSIVVGNVCLKCGYRRQ